jgi:hypothetical protein
VTDGAIAALGKPLAVARDYDELLAALRTRVEELRISRAGLDEAMKTLPDGYAGKILAPFPVRSLGRVSLGPIIQALGLAIVLVEDEKALEKMRAFIGTRNQKEAIKAMKKAAMLACKQKTAKALQCAGGRARSAKLSAWRRKQIARMGGIARWAAR